jgi:zinc transport system ATP-binding protein
MNEVIQFDNVWFSFDRNPVIKEAQFTIRHLDFVSIIGPNGAGKTTLARLMLGLLQPDNGQVRVLGKQPSQTRQHLGYVPQYSRFDP